MYRFILKGKLACLAYSRKINLVIRAGAKNNNALITRIILSARLSLSLSLVNTRSDETRIICGFFELIFVPYLRVTEREREGGWATRICNIFTRCVRKDYPTTNEQTGCVTLPSLLSTVSEFESSFPISLSLSLALAYANYPVWLK